MKVTRSSLGYFFSDFHGLKCTSKWGFTYPQLMFEAFYCQWHAPRKAFSRLCLAEALNNPTDLSHPFTKPSIERNRSFHMKSFRDALFIRDGAHALLQRFGLLQPWRDVIKNLLDVDDTGHSFGIWWEYHWNMMGLLYISINQEFESRIHPGLVKESLEETPWIFTHEVHGGSCIP